MWIVCSFGLEGRFFEKTLNWWEQKYFYKKNYIFAGEQIWRGAEEGDAEEQRETYECLQQNLPENQHHSRPLQAA